MVGSRHTMNERAIGRDHAAEASKSMSCAHTHGGDIAAIPATETHARTPNAAAKGSAAPTQPQLPAKGKSRSGSTRRKGEKQRRSAVGEVRSRTHPQTSQCGNISLMKADRRHPRTAGEGRKEAAATARRSSHPSNRFIAPRACCDLGVSRTCAQHGRPGTARTASAWQQPVTLTGRASKRSWRSTHGQMAIKQDKVE